MLEPVSVGLKFGFLAVLYLFLMWMARSALKDLRRGGLADRGRAPAMSDETGMYAASAGLSGRARNRDRLRPARRRYARPRRCRDQT
jgi:hypothetical protein